MSTKSSIGWCSITCNPIKGLCPNNCRLPDGRAYCYYSGERGFARRFKQDPQLRLDLSAFDHLPKAPKRIFLCSTNDYWGEWIPSEWRKSIRQRTQEYPQHTFQLLTKQYKTLPKYSPYPNNWWVGATANNTRMANEACLHLDIKAGLRFLSLEPMLEPINIPFELLKVCRIDWIIVGRLSGFGHKYDPKLEWVEWVVKSCDKAGVPIFLKDNLKEIWQGELTQQIPVSRTVGGNFIKIRRQESNGD